jgi:hypothetical protein
MQFTSVLDNLGIGEFLQNNGSFDLSGHNSFRTAP